MADLEGQIGELRMVLEIVRKDTGKTETIELIGTPVEQEEDE